ncbi:MAG: beta-propeller fold lactonase family protein [Legionella sp.]|nr:beta-propeller fold lactonase family protein [Legionella sp.]
MRLKNKLFLCLTLLGCIFAFQTAHAAARAKFAITPTAGSITSWLLPSNFTETIQYQVTNQMPRAYNLIMTPISGVTQITTGSGVCSSTFTLAPQQGCLLTLQINGDQIPASGIYAGPIICKTNNGSPDPFLCSQPSLNNTLAVSSTTSGEHIYITNAGANTLSMCQVNPATGRLTNCDNSAVTGLSLPEAVTINPTGDFLYVANPGSNTITVCQRNTTTGALSGCTDAGGTSFNLPSGVTVNPLGTILYVSNGTNLSGVSACDIDTSTGLLSNCINNTSSSFAGAFDITLNTTGTRTYVANFTNSTVAVCDVADKLVTNCQEAASTTFSGPEGVTLSPDNKFLYVANNTSNQVSVCEVDTITGLLNNCEITNDNFSGIGNVGLSEFGTSAYVPDFIGNRLFLCDASAVNGRLSSCENLFFTGLNNPAGIVLR